MKRREHGQPTVFFVLIRTGLLLVTAVGVEIGWIVYARGEVGKVAYSAALAAASRIDVTLYRETEEVTLLPDVFATAQNYTLMNSAFLQRRHIGMAVTGISVNPAKMVVSVSVSADLPSLIPGVDPFEEDYQITGTAEARIAGK
jgi:Flp pilus assembly protein TadG